MSVQLCSIEVTYDGQHLRVHARLNPTGARDLGVTPRKIPAQVVRMTEGGDTYSAQSLRNCLLAAVGHVMYEIDGAWRDEDTLF